MPSPSGKKIQQRPQWWKRPGGGAARRQSTLGIKQPDTIRKEVSTHMTEGKAKDDQENSQDTPFKISSPVLDLTNQSAKKGTTSAADSADTSTDADAITKDVNTDPLNLPQSKSETRRSSSISSDDRLPASYRADHLNYNSKDRDKHRSDHSSPRPESHKSRDQRSSSHSSPRGVKRSRSRSPRPSGSKRSLTRSRSPDRKKPALNPSTSTSSKQTGKSKVRKKASKSKSKGSNKIATASNNQSQTSVANNKTHVSAEPSVEVNRTRSNGDDRGVSGASDKEGLTAGASDKMTIAEKLKMIRDQSESNVRLTQTPTWTPKVNVILRFIELARCNRESFLAEHIQKYYLDKTGGLVKGMSPQLIFKVENTKFFKDFMNKRRELLDVHKQAQLTNEKFAFKAKIGFDNLSDFISEGLTVSNQPTFFKQFYIKKGSGQNAVLLYRNSDPCISWLRSKVTRSHHPCPLFLLICKVMYGKIQKEQAVGDGDFIDPNSGMDSLNAHYYDTSKLSLRAALASSKVLLIDVDADRTVRDRPRQILPYAVVLYTPDDMSEELRESVIRRVYEWKSAEVDPQCGVASARSLQSSGPKPVVKPTSNGQRKTKSAFSRNTAVPTARPGSPSCNHNSGPVSKAHTTEVTGSESQSQDHTDNHSSPPLLDAPSSSSSSHDVIPHTIHPPSKPEPEPQQTSPLLPRLEPIRLKDAEVQVKMSSIISLQKKALMLSASTQTPNLDTDDSYEASLLRGGPLVKAQTTTSRNYSAADDSAATSDGNCPIAHLSFSRPQRDRRFTSLSSRFAMSATDQSDNNNHFNDSALLIKWEKTAVVSGTRQKPVGLL